MCQADGAAASFEGVVLSAVNINLLEVFQPSQLFGDESISSVSSFPSTMHISPEPLCSSPVLQPAQFSPLLKAPTCVRAETEAELWGGLVTSFLRRRGCGNRSAAQRGGAGRGLRRVTWLREAGTRRKV